MLKGSVIEPEGNQNEGMGEVAGWGSVSNLDHLPTILLHPISAATLRVKPHQTDMQGHKGKPHLHGKLIPRVLCKPDGFAFFIERSHHSVRQRLKVWLN